MKIFLFLVLALVGYLVVAVYASRTQKPVRASIPIAFNSPSLIPGVGETLSISTWNLGYAGLGADADFVADGGESLFPPSWASTRRNLAAIFGTGGDIRYGHVSFPGSRRFQPAQFLGAAP